MILASCNTDIPSVLASPMVDPSERRVDDDPPLTPEEIEEFSRIKCCVCDTFVAPEDITKHSKNCVVPPAPNHLLQLDKWSIAASAMTEEEQRHFLHLRRKEELSRIEEIEDTLKKPMKLWWLPGTFGYIISSRWMKDWRAFVGVRHVDWRPRQRPPGPISNSDLLGLEGQIRKGLKRGLLHDYVVIEQPLWEFYYFLYSGGPPILRYNSNGQDVDLSDDPCEFDGDWKDRRPDDGKGRIFDSLTGQGFEGRIKDGYINDGFGKGILKTGSYYEGECHCGMPNGCGREVAPDGTIYEGQFLNGKLHGHGIKRNPDRTFTEDGEWVHGILCGI